MWKNKSIIKKTFFSIDNEIRQEKMSRMHPTIKRLYTESGPSKETVCFSAQQTMTAWRETSLRLVSSMTDLPLRVSDIEQIYANLIYFIQRFQLSKS